MSITFWIPQAPVYRHKPYPDEDFWVVDPVEPFIEINMTAGNTIAMLDLVCPSYVSDGYDPHGNWDQEMLAYVRANTIRALNSKIKDRALLATIESQAPGKCRFVAYGRDEQYVEQRLEQFLKLTKAAMDHGFDVSFG